MSKYHDWYGLWSHKHTGSFASSSLLRISLKQITLAAEPANTQRFKRCRGDVIWHSTFDAFYKYVWLFSRWGFVSSVKRENRVLMHFATMVLMTIAELTHYASLPRNSTSLAKLPMWQARITIPRSSSILEERGHLIMIVMCFSACLDLSKTILSTHQSPSGIRRVMNKRFH